MNKKEFESRREKLFSMMEDNSLLVLFSGVGKVKSADEDYDFEVNRNFYYLTGIEQEDSVLFMVNAFGERKTFLFISPFDKNKEKWYGKRLTPKEASDISGINNVLENTAFEARLESCLNPEIASYDVLDNVYLDFDREIKIKSEYSVKDLIASLHEKYPSLKIKDAYPLVTTLRLRKSPAEIEEFRKAIKITKLGILATINKMIPGAKEYEMADIFFHTINDLNHYHGLSFHTIMASGMHGTVLHYPTPLDTLKDGDLLLMDLGARSGYYCADVSRTFPINGKFTSVQRSLYEIVLEANKLVINLAKPGITVQDLQNATIELLATRLVEKGFLKDKKDIVNVYFHNVSHMIGLDTHDPYLSPVDRKYKELPLEEGMVISDEPGLYFEDLGIGIRIEDDLLITKDGCEVLTKEILKEPEEIEKLLASRSHL